MPQTVQYLTLAVDRERFGIAIAQVREILDMQPICRLPHAPPFVLGMIDVRGTSFPVVDLRTKFGLPRIDRTESMRIIIADVRLQQRMIGVGFVADRVDEVTSLSAATLERPPDLGFAWDRPSIAGIGRHNGDFIIVLDLAALMAGDDAALANSAPADPALANSAPADPALTDTASADAAQAGLPPSLAALPPPMQASQAA